MKIHHIGYLVKNIENAIDVLLSLGYVCESEIFFDQYRGIDIVFMVNGGYRIELVSPKTDTSVVADTLKKIGNSPYHICYCTHDIQSSALELKRQKFITIDEPAAAPAIEGKKVVFLFNKQIGIVELVEE